MPDLSLPEWNRQLRAAALVGTARRPAPSTATLGCADRPDSSPDERALDSAALAAALHRAGRSPSVATATVTAAGPDQRPAAPARALQLLDLLLDQPPAGARNSDTLLQHWLLACAGHGHRLPHPRLPAMLERGTKVGFLRTPVRAVLDERGRWLAGQNPDWAWAHTDAAPVSEDPADAETWARLPDPERLSTLHRLRAQDPDAARELLLSTWSQDPAKVRQAHLEALGPRLSLADEALLESALDDRAASVRALAADLLDGLPHSARGSRMEQRLRPLVQHKGLLGRTFEVLLPEDPDGPGIRDGLGKATAGRSARGWWLERIVAGAPFDVWGDDPARVVGKVEADVRAGLRRAAVRRQDANWARALLQLGPDPHLLAVLPAAEREQLTAGLLGRTDRAVLPELLAAVPAPWSPEFSELVVADLSRRQHTGAAQQQARLPGGYIEDLGLGTRLDPAVRPLLERWLARIPGKTPADQALARSVRQLVQLHALRDTISEAFR